LDRRFVFAARNSIAERIQTRTEVELFLQLTGFKTHAGDP
jgi:hypothetical protein